MKKKGITLLTLVTTIIIMLILISTIFISYDNIMENTQKKDFAKEVFTLKQLILEYEFMNGNYPINQEITVDLNSFELESQKQFEEEPGYDSKSIQLNTINLFEAGVNRLNRGNKEYGSDDIYAFSTNTKKLYYIKGQEIGDNIYYTLTDELYKLIGIKEVK